MMHWDLGLTYQNSVYKNLHCPWFKLHNKMLLWIPLLTYLNWYIIEMAHWFISFNKKSISGKTFNLPFTDVLRKYPLFCENMIKVSNDVSQILFITIVLKLLNWIAFAHEYFNGPLHWKCSYVWLNIFQISTVATHFRI